MRTRVSAARASHCLLPEQIFGSTWGAGGLPANESGCVLKPHPQLLT
jgi:hypothetical protein